MEAIKKIFIILVVLLSLCACSKKPLLNANDIEDVLVTRFSVTDDKTGKRYSGIFNERREVLFYDEGVLNFYKWGTSTVQHVNYGVGKNESETDPQIIDASEGDTWQTNRNKNEKQLVKAKKNTVNQTWAPFSTKTKPDIQAYLDFSKFNKEIEIK